MNINLSDHNSLNSKLKKIYDQNFEHNIKLYNIIMKKCYYQKKDNLDWYFSIAGSRNPFNSDLFKLINDYIFIQELINQKIKIKELKINNKGLYETIIIAFGNKIEKIIYLNNNFFIKSFIYSFYEFFLKIFQFTVCKFTSIFFKNYYLQKNVNLIDTYVFDQFIEKNRYYTNIENYLNNKEINENFFVTTISNLNFSNVFKLYIKIRKSKKKFIIKEDHLSYHNLFTSFMYVFRVKKINFKNIIINNIDFTHILNYELRSPKYSLNQTIEGYLSYYFIKNISYKLNVNNFICWWENQCIDKGYIYGLNKFSKKTKIKSYIGWAPRKIDFQLFPTDYEIECSIASKNIYLMSKLYNYSNISDNTSINISLAPSFRFYYLYNFFKNYNTKKIYNILIGLPIVETKAINLLKLVPIILKNVKKNINILIKAHPANNSYKIKDYLIKLKNPKVFISNKAIHKEYERADLLISNTSSICLECISINIPCIVYKDKDFNFYNPIPENLSSDLYNICNDEKELITQIENYIGRDKKQFTNNKNEADSFLLKYFTEPSKNNVTEFLYN